MLHTTCPTSRASGPGPSARSGCSRRSRACYLPLSACSSAARRAGGGPVATIGITPVLADQLALPRASASASCASCGRRAPRLPPARHRRAGARPGSTTPPRRCALGARLRMGGRRVRAPRRETCSGAFRDCATQAWSSSGPRPRPTPCCRCSRPSRARSCSCGRHRRAPRAVRRLERRPMAARVRLPPGLDEQLASAGVRAFCVDQPRATAIPLEQLAPRRTPAGPVAVPIDWDTIELVWDDRGYPARSGLPRLPPPDAQRPAAVGDRAARPTTRSAARGPCARARTRLRRTGGPPRRRATGPRADGPALIVLRARHRAARPLVVRGAARGSRRCSRRPAPPARARTLPGRSSATSRPTGRWWSPAGARARTCARGTRPASPRSPGRHGRPSCGSCRALGAGAPASGAAGRAERAARELLALQSSDWAFMATRALAGDYPRAARARPRRGAFEQRAARALARAVKDFRAMPGDRRLRRSGAGVDGRLRGLAPDLDSLPSLVRRPGSASCGRHAAAAETRPVARCRS